MAAPLLRIGTRGSALALAQAQELAARLRAAHAELGGAGAIETVVIKTTGDQVRDRTLAAIGGKGLFTKEIEEALIDRRVDLAVHSLKDLPTFLPDGLILACHLPRADPRDAFLSRRAARLAELPPGAIVGTASPRRHAQVLRLRPDLCVLPMRGNVETRLKKLDSGAVDATVLALAGLTRLGLAARVTAIVAPDEMLPAVAQGAIGVEIRADDARARAFLAPLDDAPTAAAVTAERAVLAALGGSCRTPIAALAEISGETLYLRALIIKPDGSAAVATARSGRVAEAAALGGDAGTELKARGGADFFALDLPEEKPV